MAQAHEGWCGHITFKKYMTIDSHSRKKFMLLIWKLTFEIIPKENDSTELNDHLYEGVCMLSRSAVSDSLRPHGL